jgi:hypothetical protein
MKHFLKNKYVLFTLLLFTISLMVNTTSITYGQKPGGIHYDEDGKPYANSKSDCAQANYDKLNKVIASKGFVAGPGGGWSEQKGRVYCFPCINYTGENPPADDDILKFYGQIHDDALKYAMGAAYHWCKIPGQ